MDDGSLVPGFNGDGEVHGIMGTSFSIPETDVITEQSYCYDRENKNLLVSYEEDGTLEKYVYGNGLIASSETRESQNPKYKTYLYDLRGSVTFTLDSSANITSEYRYSTYGKRNVIKGSTTSELGYCARDGVLTEVTGLLYMRARYYMPELMRFINQDIVTGDISNSNSLNRYAYVEGNPATMLDPFGLCPDKIEDYSHSSTLFKLYTMDAYAVVGTLGNKEARFDDENGNGYKKLANAEYIYTYLRYKGWSKEAICAILGNMELESYINPAIWREMENGEGVRELAFGLIQTKRLGKREDKDNKDYRLVGRVEEILQQDYEGLYYVDGKVNINKFAEENPGTLIMIELDYLIEECQNKPGKKYWNCGEYVQFKEFDDFTSSNENPKILAKAFSNIYEKSGSDNEVRETNALNWYQYFSEYN